MYIPKHYHWINPLAFILGGFWIWQNVKPQTWDVIVTGGVVMFHGIAYIGYLYEAGLIYQRYITEMNTPDPKPARAEVEPVPAYRSIPQFENSVPVVRFDMERQFAKALIVMHDFKPNDAAVDMKEKKWVRPNKFKTRAEYVALLSKWEQHGLIERKSAAKNSTYVVRRWDAVQLVAQGNAIQ